MSVNTVSSTTKNNQDQSKTETKLTRYDTLYKCLHWLIAGLILLMLLAKLGFASAITVEDKVAMLIGHSSIGSILTLFILIRLIKRFVIKSKRPVQNIVNWQRKLATAVQMILYFCMLMIPVTGYLTASLHKLPVMAFTLFNVSQVTASTYDEAAFLFIRGLHESLITLLIIMLIVHIGAALFHKFIKKDAVMSSMTPGK